MKNMTNLHRRSCFDRRTTSNRRDRWWPFFKKQTVLKNRRIDNERRKLSEKRSDWERISKWSSAPIVHKYSYPYIHGLMGSSKYPFW